MYPALSYDLSTLYMGTYLPKLWHLGKYVDHLKEFIKKNEGARVDEILEIDIATAQVKSSMSQGYFQSSRYHLPKLFGNLQQISPTQRYYAISPAGRGVKSVYAFFYREKN